MAHFAQIGPLGLVLDVINIANDDCGGGTFPESEPIGQAFIKSLNIDGLWLQTSYNSNFRHSYAIPGSQYDDDADLFIVPQPYPSWILDADYNWQAPTPCPDDPSKKYIWDESTLQWIEV